MAEVFHATSVERRFDRPIVVKRMHERLSRNPGCVDMFIDEARIVTRLKHPNIVAVYDFEATDRGLYLVMELVDGPDVFEVVKRTAGLGRPIPAEVAVYIACHALEALDYAHSATFEGRRFGVVHRDVSPSNILLSRRGQVKLADFGIARATERQRETAPGKLKGKLNYMSPEQILGAPLDGRSDVFSMGIVLAEMLTARRLFPPTPSATGKGDIERMLEGRRNLSRLDAYGTHVPPALLAILRRSLHVALGDRYPTAAAFHDALAEWLTGYHVRGNAPRLIAYLDELERATGTLAAGCRATSSSAGSGSSGPGSGSSSPGSGSSSSGSGPSSSGSGSNS
jgi:serine/threonine-protein kinase